MIILDNPYVSDFLKETIIKYNIPVINTQTARKFVSEKEINFISEEDAVIQYKNDPFLIYSNSENAIDWVNTNLRTTDLPETINIFKDKIKFRELTKEMLPGLYFKEVTFDEIKELDYKEFPAKFVLKPTVGFFSMGVYIIENEKQLTKAKHDIKLEIQRVKDLYPNTVLDVDRFIIEEYLEGEEFAFDAYYNNNGEAVVLGIMKHLFASSTDVSDRVYYTSKEIIEQYVPVFEKFLNDLNGIINIKNFPLHVEVRINEEGKLLPIEVNPMRFGAWCTSADLAYYAFNYNSIAHLMEHKKPNWDQILEGTQGKRCSIVILNNSTGYAPNEIKTVDYDAIMKRFKKPLELRKSDFKKQPHFGFLFVETQIEDWNEIEDILVDNLKAYVTI